MGAGSLATFLATALRDAGFTITEIIARNSPRSRRRALLLATKVGAQIVTIDSAALNATLLWFCVPDAQIRSAATALALRLSVSKRTASQVTAKSKVRCAFHSSGALGSAELQPLRKASFALASVHPLMTFVAGAHPALADVPFAVEGDPAATRLAGRIIRMLGGKSFLLPPARKAAYHAWATLASPLFVAFLVMLEEAARAAGIRPEDARHKSLPIITQTLANYSRLGPAQAFSGPLIRGDVSTVAKHLAALKKSPGTREAYMALARVAHRRLPVKNRERLRQLLQDRQRD
jgi:predicted short-subunit dehydrogenase-like oxidoreductase (DUF2520 family)